jgi:hypothetical protein
MSKAFGLVLMLISLYIGMTIYQKGLENAFGGAFAPLESVRGDGGALESEITPSAQFDAAGPADRERKVFITDAVRQKVNADLQMGARRRGYEAQ